MLRIRLLFLNWWVLVDWLNVEVRISLLEREELVISFVSSASRELSAARWLKIRFRKEAVISHLLSLLVDVCLIGCFVRWRVVILLWKTLIFLISFPPFAGPVSRSHTHPNQPLDTTTDHFTCDRRIKAFYTRSAVQSPATRQVHTT